MFFKHSVAISYLGDKNMWNFVAIFKNDNSQLFQNMGGNYLHKGR